MEMYGITVENLVALWHITKHTSGGGTQCIFPATVTDKRGTAFTWMHKPQYYAKQCGGLKGDVDLNGTVDMNDVVALMQHVLLAEIITDANALANGEVTNDSSLDMNDVVKLMQYVLKAIDSLD